ASWCSAAWLASSFSLPASLSWAASTELLQAARKVTLFVCCCCCLLLLVVIVAACRCCLLLVAVVFVLVAVVRNSVPSKDVEEQPGPI
ncbi:unnamed protein product, partial [Polarella glacialis]